MSQKYNFCLIFVRCSVCRKKEIAIQRAITHTNTDYRGASELRGPQESRHTYWNPYQPISSPYDGQQQQQQQHRAPPPRRRQRVRTQPRQRTPNNQVQT